MVDYDRDIGDYGHPGPIESREYHNVAAVDRQTPMSLLADCQKKVSMLGDQINMLEERLSVITRPIPASPAPSDGMKTPGPSGNSALSSEISDISQRVGYQIERLRTLISVIDL